MHEYFPVGYFKQFSLNRISANLVFARRYFLNIHHLPLLAVLSLLSGSHQYFSIISSVDNCLVKSAIVLRYFSPYPRTYARDILESIEYLAAEHKPNDEYWCSFVLSLPSVACSHNLYRNSVHYIHNFVHVFI